LGGQIIKNTDWSTSTSLFDGSFDHLI
jgi:hypothetical protein